MTNPGKHPGDLQIMLKHFLIHATLTMATLGTVHAAPPVTEISSIAAGMKWIGKAVDDPEYYVWCTSPIEGTDKKIHLFCSRWPKKHGMNGWTTHSEIVHYIGDTPEGPFTFADLAIPANPGAPWNNSIHNPAIFKFGSKYALLYITFDHRKDSPFLQGETPGCGKMYTCMATADSLSGPWTKQGKDGMIVEPSMDPGHWSYQSWSLDNPTMLKANGKYFIYFKCAKQQMKSRYGYAVADKLEGPYHLSNAPCTDNINYIEDATAFLWNNKYCLLTNDNMGSHTGIAGGGILWQADTPVDFKLANAQIGFLKTSDYAKNVDKSKARALYGNVFKFERPGILMLGGKPAYFYGPSGVNLDGDDHTCSYVMKIDVDHPSPEFARPISHQAKASASGFWNESPGHNPEMAVDSSSGTRWAAERSARAAWLAVDLGKEKDIRRIRVEEPAEYARISRFDIQVKDASGQWQTIATGRTINGCKEFPLTQPVRGREFRLNVIEASDSPTLSEFQLFQD